MRIRIRPYQLSDSISLYEAARESVSEVYPWLPWCHPDYEQVEGDDWIKQQVTNFAERSGFEFVIESPSGEFLGGCGLNQIDVENDRANLGYWVSRSR